MKIAKYLSLLLVGLICFVSCIQSRCDRKARYVMEHCSSLLKTDTIEVKVDSIIKQLVLQSDTMFIPDSNLADTLRILDSLYRLKHLPKKEYVYSVQKVACGELELHKDTLGIELSIYYKNGVLAYYLDKKEQAISINAKVPTKTVYIEHKPSIFQYFMWVFPWVLFLLTLLVMFLHKQRN